MLWLSSSAYASPAFVQECVKGNGGVSTTNYTVTIASSGGTAGCTSSYTAGDALVIGYVVGSGSSFSAVTDLTSSSASATGATITWHKAVSLQSSVGGASQFVGVLYACSGDISSPTSSIAVTVNMGAGRAAITAIYVTEVSGVASASCYDSNSYSSASGNSCCGTTNVTTNANSGTLSSATEFIIATGVAFSGTSPTIAHGNYTAGPIAETIPTNGKDVESSPSGSISWTEYCVTTATTASESTATAGGSGGAPTYDIFIHVGFLPAPPPAPNHHQLFNR
jgi:hypothetical protein